MSILPPMTKRSRVGPQIISYSLKQLVVLLNRPNGFHRGPVQYPAENKDSYGEPDLPCTRRLRSPPNQGQRQRPHRADCDDNKGFPEIPWYFFFCNSWAGGGIQKLTTVLALYRFVLNLFSAEWTLFHYHLSWQNEVIPNMSKAMIPGRSKSTPRVSTALPDLHN